MRQDVQLFLNSLIKYLYGDLETFRRISDEIELQESSVSKQSPEEIGSGSNGSAGRSSSTTTFETTNPGGTSGPVDYSVGSQTSGTSGASGNAGTSGDPQKHGGYPIRFRSTIPHALAVLSAMDIFGYLVGVADKALNTTENIKQFLNGKVSDPQLFCLVFLFRHGMAHSFFPKKQISIAAHSTLEGKPLFYLDSNETITLNVNTLISITKERINSIMENSSLHPNMENQYDKLLNEDDIRLTKEKEKFDIIAFAKTLERVEFL